MAEPLSTVIVAYLRAAEAGNATDGDGRPLSPAGVRSRRRALSQVEAVVGVTTLDVARMDDAAIHDLAGLVLRGSALPPDRDGAIVEALRGLVSFARAEQTTVDAPQPDGAPTPTSAMLLLGARSGAMAERLIVLAFVLTAIALALALA